MKRFVTIIVLISVVLAACTKAEETPAPTAAQSAAGIATAIATEVAPTAASIGGGTKPEPTPAGEPIKHMAAGDPVFVSNVKMFEVMRGVGVGTPKEGGDDHVLVTYESGQSFQDITPPEAASTDKVKKATIFFANMDQGWVTYYPEDFVQQPSAVWHTADRGKTWEASAIPAANGITAFKLQKLYFVDNENGWLVLTGETSGDNAPAAVYRTTDGKTWDLAVEPLSKDSGTIDQCCQTGITFLDKNVGIITSATMADPKPHANWTTDGGKSWQSQVIPSADEAQFAKSMCGTYSPNAINEQTVVILVDCVEYIGMEQNHTPFLYFSTDQGKNWQWLPMQIPPLAEGEWQSITRNTRLQFLDAQVGWAFVEDTYIHKKDPNKNEIKNQIYQTRDGGQTWTKVDTTLWFGQYTFLSADQGWVATRAADTYSLIQTIDGGKKWVKITPVIR